MVSPCLHCILMTQLPNVSLTMVTCWQDFISTRFLQNFSINVLELCQESGSITPREHIVSSRFPLPKQSPRYFLKCWMKVFYLMILCHYRKRAAAQVLHNQNQTVKLPICLYNLFKEILAVEISRSSETVVLPFSLLHIPSGGWKT